jgi:hypothetical protein
MWLVGCVQEILVQCNAEGVVGTAADSAVLPMAKI